MATYVVLQIITIFDISGESKIVHIWNRSFAIYGEI